MPQRRCRASPQPEVAKAAPELMRSLLYVSTPAWVGQEYSASSPLHPDRRRLGSMAAALAAAPDAAAAALLEHMFTDNVATQQRLLALDTFSAAAAELAGAPTLAPLTATGAHCEHELALCHVAVEHSSTIPLSSSVAHYLGCTDFSSEVECCRTGAKYVCGGRGACPRGLGVFV